MRQSTDDGATGSWREEAEAVEGDERGEAARRDNQPTTQSTNDGATRQSTDDGATSWREEAVEGDERGEAVQHDNNDDGATQQPTDDGATQPVSYSFAPRLPGPDHQSAIRPRLVLLLLPGRRRGLLWRLRWHDGAMRQSTDKGATGSWREEAEAVEGDERGEAARRDNQPTTAQRDNQQTMAQHHGVKRRLREMRGEKPCNTTTTDDSATQQPTDDGATQPVSYSFAPRLPGPDRQSAIRPRLVLLLLPGRRRGLLP
jgi:hypothetical protein